MEQTYLFGPNFLERLVGKAILQDPKVAIIELIANAWDAGATEVKILWPSGKNKEFSIQDNGIGLSENQFLSRWRTLGYDRLTEIGNTINVDGKVRKVFGKNGIGRFAGFCFDKKYFVHSTKDNTSILYEVTQGNDSKPFDLKKINTNTNNLDNGTRIYVENITSLLCSEEAIRAEIGMRFLTDPLFNCYVNNKKIIFSDIPSTNIQISELFTSDGHKFNITIIDTNEVDKSTNQHGISWHVNNRLVGNTDWKSYGFDDYVDGRSSEAKRYSFIITADHLANSSVKQDWTSFLNTEAFLEVKNSSFEFIKDFIYNQSKEKREKTLASLKQKYSKQINNLTILKKERWEKFITNVQKECNNFSEKDLDKLSKILLTLEKSESKYLLLEQLQILSTNQVDDLADILSNWTLDLAKEVLDELQIRLKLLNELKSKIIDINAKEVQDLQPLFHRGLWIFGPEFESIEYTSNEGMTRVIQKIFKKDLTGSLNRPDFAISADSTIGTYGYNKYDEHGGEIGIDRLVIVELKKPGIKISTDEKAQCWKYVKELLEKGLIDKNTSVTCFVIGSHIDPFENAPRKENNEKCIIQPLSYDIVISRAKSRLLKLYDKVKDAPFLSKPENQDLMEDLFPTFDYEFE